MDRKLNKEETALYIEARKRLESGGFALVYSTGGSLLGKSGTGIKPLYEIAAHEADKPHEILADKVIGRAAAFLSIKIGFKAVFAFSMSLGAIKLLQENGVHWECIEKADRILNRKGDDICPMEKATAECNNGDEAFLAIERKLKEFNLI